MPKATAEAPANLAFVKYWGKKDAALRLPSNNSISMNLSNALTVTTVEFSAALDADRVLLGEAEARPDFAARTSRHLDRLRAIAGVNTRAHVVTRNSFPAGVGIASSASGFAALTAAAAWALGLDLPERELSALARLGSGSASRSVPSGFVEWYAGESSETSYAAQIAPPEHWPIAVVTVIVSRAEKKLSSTDGHALAQASPFFQARLQTLPARLEAVRAAILQRDFHAFGRQVEQEAVSFHSIAMTSPIESAPGWSSGGYYWTPDTLELILAVQRWRGEGLPVYFTLDAGPTVHLVCPAEAVPSVQEAVKRVERLDDDRQWEMMINKPAPGVRRIEAQRA